MRVLWFTNIIMPEYARALGRTGYNTGGWMTGLLNALRELAPDLDLTIACQGQSTTCTVNGTTYCAFPACRGAIYAPKNRRQFVEGIRKCVETAKPDLIHFHGTENCVQYYYQETGLKIPTVTTIQGLISGCLSHFYGGLLPYQLKRHHSRLLSFLLRYPSIANQGEEVVKRAALEKKILEAGGNFCGRTDWDEAWVRMVNPQSRYSFVGEILRDAFYRQTNRDVEKIRPHSIYCGNAIRSLLKGGHYLLGAIAMLKGEYPDIRVYIANSEVMERKDLRHRVGMSDYERMIRAMIKELDIEKNLVFLPSLNENEVREQLLTAEVFALPSMIENSPNALGEALLLKTPIVATDVGGIPSMVAREDAILVHSGDSAELANGIRRVFSDSKSAMERAERAYAVAVKRFDRKTVVMNLINAYQMALNNGSGER